MKRIVVVSIIFFFVGSAFAQTGIGLRFASNINFFPRASEQQLVDNGFTTGVFGIFLSSYKEKSGFELGININYKNGDDKGFPSLPVVMQDFGNDGQNVGITGIEMDLKVGPRLGAINPKIGYVLGYYAQQSGFFEDGVDGDLNRIYLMLPFGMSVNLPTNYGSVGFGGYYNVGIFNVRKNPNPNSGFSFNGGRHHYLNLEITVTYDFRRR